MSLDVYLETEPCPHCGRYETVYTANITHNLCEMAGHAGIYNAVWCPEECGVTHARQMVKILTDGLTLLAKHPDEFKRLNPPNGWGTYQYLFDFTREYLNACEEHPDAKVRVWK